MRRESVVSSLLGSMSKGKRDRDQNVAQILRTKSLNGKLNWPCDEKSWLSKEFSKLKQKLRRGIGKREFLTSLFRRSIRSLNLHDFSFIKHVDGQIRHTELK